ncbi:MAG: hypothetical protein ACK4IS_13325 [Erythrobacter sp.]
MGERVQEVIDTLLMQRNAKRAFHYQAVFFGEGKQLTPHAEKVIADLRDFCRANKTTFDADPRVHALLEGRREVILRIFDMLGIDSREVRHFVEVKDE